MAPNHTRFTANVASKRPHQVIDVEMKLKVIKDCEGRKSVMAIAHQSGMSHSTIATILKNKNKMTEAVKVNLTSFIEGSETNKNSRRAYIRSGETLMTELKARQSRVSISVL